MGNIKKYDNMIEQVKQSEEWLEERLLVDNELELKLREMFSDSSYVDWLLNFTLKYSKFKDTEWMYYPDNISPEDYKRVNDMDLFYYGIKKYADENHRYPITTGSGIFYRIKYNDVGFTIGIVGGLNVEYICSREELDPEKSYIDLSYIINNKKCEDVDFIDAQMKSLSNLIITLHQSGVPIESMESTFVEIINRIKPQKDDTAVKALKI